MKHMRKRLRQYVATLLVVTMVFTQFGTSYAQGGGMNGIRRYDTYDTATASDGENKISAGPDEDHVDVDYEHEDENEILLEDDRYDDATASELPPSGLQDPETASRSNAARMASETYLLRYKAVVGGSSRIIYEEEVCEGDDGIPPEVPEREGYTFSGWSGSYVNVTASRTITAKYVTGDQELHTVKFLDENGRLVTNQQYVADGKGAICPGKSEYQRTGYTFLNWDQEFYNVTEDMEIRARYLEGEVPTRWLSYHGYYKDVYTELKYECVPEGENGTPPEVPAREGYTFSGWSGAYANSNYWGKVTASYLIGEHTMHTVRFVDETGRLVTNEQYVAEGKGAIRPNASVYKRDGYTFLGLDQEFYNVTEDMEIRARYQEGEVPTRWLSYYGYYKDVYTELKYECVPEGENGTPPEVPAREGYTFSGWSGAYANSNYWGKVTASYLTGEHTMHTVRFVDETGRLVVNERYVVSGKGANAPARSAYNREGYTFLGWDREFYHVTEDLVVRPRYQTGEFTTYRLVYKAYHNNVLTEIKQEWVPKGQNGIPPTVTEREGYSFAGWTPESSYLNVSRTYDITAKYVSGDMKMHVVYFEGKRTGSDKYTKLKIEYVPEGSNATPPILPEYAGHTFREWGGDYTDIRQDKTIYAFYDTKTYTVNFWNGETLLKSQEVQYGSWATAPSAPAAPEGYYFSGWDKDYRKVEGSLDVYAVFEPIEGVVNLITTEEFKQKIRALDLPEDIKESLIDLGVTVRVELDKYINVNSRSSPAITMDQLYYFTPLLMLNPAVLTAIGVVGLGVVVWVINYGTLYLIWQGILEAMEILGEYVGEPIAKAITAELTMSIELELEAEGGSEAGKTEADLQDAAMAALMAEYAYLQTLSDNQRQKASTIAAGYNRVTGEIGVGVNISEKYHGLICAEDLVVEQLGGIESIDDIVLTPAIRPRTGEIVAVCKRCQSKYPRSSFMPGTPFEE